jgi:hypothetical protein
MKVEEVISSLQTFEMNFSNKLEKKEKITLVQKMLFKSVKNDFLSQFRT